MFSFEEKYQTTAKIGKSLKMTMKAAGIIALLRKKVVRQGAYVEPINAIFSISR